MADIMKYKSVPSTGVNEVHLTESSFSQQKTQAISNLDCLHKSATDLSPYNASGSFGHVLRLRQLASYMKLTCGIRCYKLSTSD